MRCKGNNLTLLLSIFAHYVINNNLCIINITLTDKNNAHEDTY